MEALIITFAVGAGIGVVIGAWFGRVATVAEMKRDTLRAMRNPAELENRIEIMKALLDGSAR